METLILKPIQNAIPNRWTKLNFNSKDILTTIAIIAITVLYLDSLISFTGALVLFCLIGLSLVAYELHIISKADYDLDLSDVGREMWK